MLDMRANYQTVDDADPIIVHHNHSHNGNGGNVNAIEVSDGADDSTSSGVVTQQGHIEVSCDEANLTSSGVAGQKHPVCFGGCPRPPTAVVAAAATVVAAVFFASIAVLLTNANANQRPAGNNNTTNATTTGGEPACPSIIWSDEFDGDGPDLDLTKWSYQDGDGCDLGICGWGNAELEVYRGESNIRLVNGSLIIEARLLEGEGGDAGGAKRYTSGKIIGRGKADFGPVGRFEARVKLPRGDGMWPAFWMLPSDEKKYGGGWPMSGEIDIMENIGREGPNTVHGTIHYGHKWPNHQYAESGIHLSADTNGDFSDTFHLFAVEREPGVIRWFVDDVLYHTVTSDDIFPYDWPFDEDFFFIINLAVGGTWPGPPGNGTVFPQKMEVDHVRVYDGSFPRIDGRDEVDQFATGVTYGVVGVGGDDNDSDIYTYTWSVPPDANITGGQGTRSITVDFGRESGIISLNYTTTEDGAAAPPCITDGTSRNGPGIRVKVLDDCATCREYTFDCGCPTTCTRHVLNRDADGHTCGDRIEWLMDSAGKTEADACEQIGVEEFNGICGPCKGPENC